MPLPRRRSTPYLALARGIFSAVQATPPRLLSVATGPSASLRVADGADTELGGRQARLWLVGCIQGVIFPARPYCWRRRILRRQGISGSPFFDLAGGRGLVFTPPPAGGVPRHGMNGNRSFRRGRQAVLLFQSPRAREVSLFWFWAQVSRDGFADDGRDGPIGGPGLFPAQGLFE